MADHEIMSVEGELLLEGRILEGTQDRAKHEVLIDLIREGFGNKRDGHYYGRSLLERAAPQFAGAKQYINHIDAETERKLNGLPRPIEHLGGRITETQFMRPGEDLTEEGWGVNTSDRAIIRGRARVAQPWLWSMIENDPELLGVSIHAGGKSNPGVMEGRQAKVVEAISHVRSVDWVTEAGAGGKVFALVEAQIEAEEADELSTTLIEDDAVSADDPRVAAEMARLKKKGMSDAQARAFAMNIAKREKAGSPVSESEIDTAVELAMEAPAEETPLRTSAVEANAISPARSTADQTTFSPADGTRDTQDASGMVKDLSQSPSNPSPVCGICGGPTMPAPQADGFMCPNGHITPMANAPEAVHVRQDAQDAEGGWVPEMDMSGHGAMPGAKMKVSLEAAVLSLLEVLDGEEALEGALTGAEIEGDVDPELAEAWRVFSAFAQDDPDGAAALVEAAESDDDEDNEEDGDVNTDQIEARAVEIAEERLADALEAATATMRSEFERQLQLQESDYNRKLQEAHAGFERRLEQKDQRFLAARLIEQAGFKAPTESALKQDFHDAYFEAETDADGAVVRSGEDRLRSAVQEAIKTKRAELSAYVEARVSGAGESEQSLREAGVNSGGRAKAPLDNEIDSIIGITPKE